MLIYAFWHRPDHDRTSGYEQALVEFHGRLVGAGVPGLVGSATYRVRDLPWLGAGAGYEDWYVVGGFGDLERLNRDAVGDRLRPFHDRPAHAAVFGAGGLYAPQAGVPDLRASVVTWLSKPRGVPYPDYHASLPAVPFLLRRQLALGPALEYCAAGDLPGGLLSRREPLFVSEQVF